MSTTIESLELEVLSNSTSAESGLDALTQSLEKLKNATKGGLGLTSVAKQIQSVSNATNSIQPSSVSNLNGLAKAIQLLSGVKISSTIGTQLTAITASLNGMQIDSSANTKIQELITTLQPLSQLPKANLTSFITQLGKIPKVLTDLNSVDMDAFAAKISQVTNAVKPLANEMNKIAAGFSSFPTKIQKLISSNDRLVQSNKKVAGSFTDVFYKVKSFINIISRVGKTIYKFIDMSSDYIENVNLFDVSMGKYASGAKAYAEQVGEAMGIDPGEWMRNQGLFQTLITGFGVAGDSAQGMSKNLTQLAYDLSSFYNIDVETAMQKLKSGMAGELEPLRAIGYDLSQAKLEATAAELGINKAVSSMTQAEKSMLRYHAIMTQVTSTHGDMARTLDQPANQLRVLKAQLTMLGREIGNVFLPLLQTVLPYLIAGTKVLREIVSAIALLVGYEPPELKDTGVDNLASGSEDAATALGEASDEAKKLKSYMLGFDELNVINPDNGSSDTNLGAFDMELPSYGSAFLSEDGESALSKIIEKMKEWLGITGKIETWADFFDTKLGNFLKYVGLIGGGLLLWKLSKGFLAGITALGKLLKTKTAKFAIAATITITIMGVDAAKWIIENTEDTLSEVTAIVGASLLGLGAILAFAGINIPLGIGLMAVGAVSLASSIAMNTSKLSDEIKGVIAIITTAVSGALLTVGAILAFSGVNIPLGIALMVGGALTLASSVVPNWDSLSQEVKDVITIIAGSLGSALLVMGAIFAFSGANIPLGIGLMLAGAVSLGSAIALNWTGLSDEMERTVGLIAAILGGALLVVGGILAFSGANIPLGIALMTLGAASLGSAAALNWDTVLDALTGTAGKITAVISGALLAVGALLAFSGVHIPLGIALMTLGAAGLATVATLNWESVTEALRGPIGETTAIISGALLALGAILAFSGIALPLGIGLMLAGAAGLATVVALNWDSIVEAVRGPFGKIMAIAGAAALVIGLILLFTGVGIPLGLGLILGGVASLGTAIGFNWDSIVDAIKGVWKKITDFWNQYIAPVFTAEWWANLGKTIINGLISGVEGGINGIIGAFESMVNFMVDALNTLSFDVPDWVPLIGGQKFGFNIPRASFGRVSIPRLAEGGFPDQGQMFIAREAGPELVGNIGRRTAVVNNEQIVESISVGVAEANSEQNSLLREQNSLLRALLEKDSGVYLDGRSLSTSVDKYKREHGRELIIGGAL